MASTDRLDPTRLHRAPGDTVKAPARGGDIFIVDNSDANWKVRSYLADWCELSSAIDIATGYFEIGALLSLAEKWQTVDRIRILGEIDAVIEAHGGWPMR